MPQSDKELKIAITADSSSAVEATKAAEAAVSGLKDQADDLGKKMGVVNVSQDEVNKILAKTSEQVDEEGKKIEESGDKAARSGEKHRALRHMLMELNSVIPGLGESIHLLSASYLEAGEAAETGAAGVQSFKVAMEEAVASMGPLIVAMLSIQAVMEYWDLYKEKVKAAAEAQAEASKKIIEATNEARKAVEELEAAMHPKEKNIASRDEAALKKQQQDLENAYNRQKELNKANEETELKGAGSEAEKEEIKKRFEALNTALDDWRAKQNAAIEGAMVPTMQSQLQQLQKAQEPIIKRMHDEYQSGLKTGDFWAYNQDKDLLNKIAAEAKALRDKLDDLDTTQSTDASTAGFNAETHRQAFAAKGINYNPPGAGFSVPSFDPSFDNADNKFTTGKSIADTAARGGKVSDEQQQFLVVLEQSITGQKLTFAQATALMEAQSKNQEFAVQLLQNAHARIDAVSAKLAELDQQIKHSSVNFAH